MSRSVTRHVQKRFRESSHAGRRSRCDLAERLVSPTARQQVSRQRCTGLQPRCSFRFADRVNVEQPISNKIHEQERLKGKEEELLLQHCSRTDTQENRAEHQRLGVRGGSGGRCAALPLGDNICNIQPLLPVCCCSDGERRSASSSGHETDSKSNKELRVVSPGGDITLRERTHAVSPPNWEILQEVEKRHHD